MRIFVAGASGVIGRLLVPMLAGAGFEVIGMTGREANAGRILALGARPVVADAFDRDAVMKAVADARPDVIMHQLTSLSEWNLADNAAIRKAGTRHLVDAAKACGVRRLVAQSIAWAYRAGDGPASEHEPLDTEADMPRKVTIEGAAALEQAASELPEAVVLRYGMLYGPGTWYARDGLMAGRIMRREIPATEGMTSFVHVEDAARAAVLALDWPPGPVNIVDDEPASGTEWLPHYARLLGAPEPEAQSGGNGWERGASNGQARSAYGWEPLHPSWREGFASSLSVSRDA